ncbi:MAG: 4'-phosphopantetheinyl transferase superfamily protein, partial [Gammaproteobacteria bacterium]|nr:4'-phosphopantetheinyl transferase superfamily protein [Gammaproteobacteria bacterium]
MSQSESLLVYSRYTPGTTDLDFLVNKYLDAADREYFSTLKSAGRQHEFALGRALTKQLLSDEFGKPAEYWQIGRAESGRPELRNDGFTQVDISISHSGGLVLVGMSTQGRIGVDVEKYKSKRDVFRLAQNYFHTNETQLLQYESPVKLIHTFYILWTLKEAYAKASGENLYSILGQYDFSTILQGNKEGQWTDISACVAGEYSALFSQLGNELPYAVVTTGRSGALSDSPMLYN